MPRKTKRQQQVSKIPRKKGRYVSLETITREIETVENENRLENEIDNKWPEDETIDWTEEELKEFDKIEKKLISEVLHWHEDAACSIRAVYTGNSRTTIWRKGKKKQELDDDAKGMRMLDTFFKSSEILHSPQPSQSSPPQLSSPSSPIPSPTPSPFPEISPFSIDNLHTRLKEIDQQCIISKSAKSNEKILTYDYLRCLSIRRFIQLLLDGQGKMNASDNIAQIIWNKGNYMARCIRKWGTYYIRTGKLLIYRQGKHTKLESLVDDEDFKEECLMWLRQQAPESRSPKCLKTYIEGMVFPKLTGHIKKDTISEKTCQNYMHKWGFKYDEKKKGVYYDGHERPDVVAYRKEWLNRMFEYKKYMKDFDGDMLDIVLEPQLKSGNKELVQVTHDECHFYANDGQRKIWTIEDEDILRSKHIGRSIMVSAFLCPCHGLLQLSDEQLQANPHIKNKEAFILRSIQTDGYWKSEHMLDQVWVSSCL
jgi:hypothetical protein